MEHQPNYIDTLLQELGALQPGDVSIATLLHEDDCPRPDGGACTCKPEVLVERKSDQ